MIEAVNSTIANVAASRGVALQASAASATLPPLPEGAPNVPQAPFVSPYISVDLDFDTAVLQIRDSETGDVQQQFPTQSRLAQIRRAHDVQERADLQQNRQQPVNNVTSSQGPDVVTIQDVTSAQASNTSLPAPQIAVAALSTGAQSGQVSQSAGVSVLA
tara:strand:- start:45727 stop:46206 length:480 start_codon:yes stop_codon:yes gene_type:complete